MFKLVIVWGVFVIGKSLLVVLLIFMLVDWVDKVMVINNLKGVEKFSLVVG